MSTNKNDSGWVVESRPDLKKQVAQDAPTKMVQADWIMAQSEGSTACCDGASDATVVAKPMNNAEQPTSRRSAQYIPSIGMRNTGEVTNVWTPNRPNVKEIIGSIKKVFEPKRTKILSLICFVALCAVAAFNCIKTTPNPSPFVYEAEQQSKAKTSQKLPREESPSIQNGEAHGELPGSPPSLKAAADALVDGKLVEALRVYRELAKASPDDESFQLAVQILSRSKGGQ